MVETRIQHGTPSGYTAHYTIWKTPPCEPCKQAQKDYRNPRDKKTRASLGFNPRRLKNHNLAPELYLLALSRYEGMCWVCQTEPAKHIDHDHSCCPENYRSCGDCFRGLLCSNCNTGLGLFKDDPERLKNALSYIVRESPLTYNI